MNFLTVIPMYNNTSFYYLYNIKTLKKGIETTRILRFIKFLSERYKIYEIYFLK